MGYGMIAFSTLLPETRRVVVFQQEVYHTEHLCVVLATDHLRNVKKRRAAEVSFCQNPFKVLQCVRFVVLNSGITSDSNFRRAFRNLLRRQSWLGSWSFSKRNPPKIFSASTKSTKAPQPLLPVQKSCGIAAVIHMIHISLLPTQPTESGDTICYATVITVIVPASAFQHQVLPTVDVDLQHIQRLTSISRARCMEKNLLA